MSFDEISLQLPADQAFHRVAHLVLGGLAIRLDLTFESLEDIELALDALLERAGNGASASIGKRIALDCGGRPRVDRSSLPGHRRTVPRVGCCEQLTLLE